MADLLSLPHELVEQILKQLTLTDLKNMCLTCKALREEGTPELYRDLVVTAETLEFSRGGTLLRNRDNLKNVRSIETCRLRLEVRVFKDQRAFTAVSQRCAGASIEAPHVCLLDNMPHCASLTSLAVLYTVRETRV
jgi:hypothetical protein